MQTQPIERRLQASPARQAPEKAAMARIVQQGLLIQDGLGTIGAVEFLKTHDIDGAVIHRVLTSRQVRAQDRAATAGVVIAPAGLDPGPARVAARVAAQINRP